MSEGVRCGHNHRPSSGSGPSAVSPSAPRPRRAGCRFRCPRRARRGRRTWRSGHVRAQPTRRLSVGRHVCQQMTAGPAGQGTGCVEGSRVSSLRSFHLHAVGVQVLENGGVAEPEQVELRLGADLQLLPGGHHEQVAAADGPGRMTLPARLPCRRTPATPPNRPLCAGAWSRRRAACGQGPRLRHGAQPGVCPRRASAHRSRSTAGPAVRARTPDRALAGPRSVPVGRALGTPPLPPGCP